MILNGDTECSDTANFNITIFPTIDGDFSFDYDTCYAGPIAFEDLTVTAAQSVVAWDWNFQNIGISDLKNPEFTFDTPGLKRVNFNLGR